MPFIAVFLFLWWIPGAGIGTFRDPFQDTGNGYFASWAALIFSLQLAANNFGALAPAKTAAAGSA